MLAAPQRALLALVLVVLTLVSGGCGNTASPELGSGLERSLSATAPSGALQEVAPPGAVQQLNEQLNERSPQVRVIAPADQALLPAGPWSLKVEVKDWPLTDAGDLGLGPHLVVQLDDQEPLRISSTEAAANVAMPDLRPGSHRVTVYAARPWGEAVKAPGASAQIRLNRVARNAAELPANGSAQLIAASPDALQQMEPVLIDWLLLDAPLQNLRGDDARWRLRISVNGDSFLVDRQTPLWLKGFKRGSNAVQLELLDGRGDPLNPPFNSVVREVVISTGNRAAWQRSNLSSSELALLSGEPQPEAQAAPATPTQPEPETTAETATEPTTATATPASSSAGDIKNNGATENGGTENGGTENRAAEAEAPAFEQPEPGELPLPEPMPAPATAVGELSETPSEPPLEAPLTTPEPIREDKPNTVPAATDQGPARSETPEQRLAPQSSLSGSARDQVNADGSLQKPVPRGPLAGLREKLGG